jgi:hypothetical protein|nr:MAG TPA: antitoxin [Caudoviricetes sp.]DAK31669.1 MAG TPA: antitoxin [Caudoviricetes sp.]DAK49412.1 MAG TPA: antitoxin [Caudoviricetes sp.]DAO11927.1 MAG TPA: antitoxin [Caudoviricetes sp.]DAO38768.1 MAG TPA: antitoxin [Caudoviricetes sp.]
MIEQKKTQEEADDEILNKNFDFKHAVKNPYIERLRGQDSVIVDMEAIKYFKEMAKGMGTDWKTLVNMYLVDAVNQKKKVRWD